LKMLCGHPSCKCCFVLFKFLLFFFSFGDSSLVARLKTSRNDKS